MSKKKKKPVKASKKTPAKVAKKEPEKEPKKKKKHKGLIVLCVLLCIFVVFPIAFVFIAFFDTSTKTVSDKDVTYQNIVSEAFYNGLSKLDESNPKFDLTINEEMIDGILMAGCEKINQPTYIPKMYCYIDGNNYTFAMDVQASFFKSRVLLHTTLDTEGEGFKKTLIFQINKLTLGRLPIPVKWITAIVGNFVNDDMLNNAFASAHFHAKSHLSEAKITYDRETFKEDVGYYVSTLGGNNPFLDVVLEMLGDEKHEILSTNYHDGVTATFNLKSMTAAESKHADNEAPLKFVNLDKHKKFINDCLDKNLFNEETDAATMMTYLIRGYDENNKTIIDLVNGMKEELKVELTTYLGGVDIKSYKGEKCRDDETFFQDYCSDTIENCNINIDPLDPTAGKYTLTFSVNKDDINRYLAFTMTEAIGKTIQISFLDSEKKWGFNCMVVDNIYVGFEGELDNPIMVIYLQININGAKLLLTVSTHNIHLEESTQDQLGKLYFELKEIEFGSIPVSTSNPMFEQLLNLLPTSETGNEVFTHIQKEGKHFFCIDLEPIVKFPEMPEFLEEIILKTIADNENEFKASLGEESGTLNFSAEGISPTP